MLDLTRWRVGLLSLAFLATACATPVGVERVDPREVRIQLVRNALITGEPSATSRQLLDRLDQVEAWDDDPAAALEAIRAGLGGPDTPERLIGLAELCFVHAEEGGGQEWYRASALFAYAFLFPGAAGEPPNPFNPGLRMAAELYNRSLALGFSGRADGSLRTMAGAWELPFGEIHLEIDPEHPGWPGYRLLDVVPASELQVRGLRNRYRRVGIGAPLAAGTERIEGGSRGHEVSKRFRIPVTALLRFDDPHDAVRSGQVEADLEFYVLDREPVVEIDGREVPLEYEPTAALAAGLSDQEIWDFELAGFFGGDFDPFKEIEDGLILIHPYRPGRVPVVLVHGTASSPGRWAELVNELNGDPALASRIQLWLFIYNTGNPILFSAERLRSALAHTVEDLDPEGRDAALQSMVVIGHSQGGMLTRLQATASEDRFWSGISSKPFDEMKMSDKDRALLEPAIFFEPLSFVKRVVYMCTPHRGSYQARRQIAGWVAGFIRTSLDITAATLDVVTRNPGLILDRRRLPTSLENMTPGNRFLKAYGTLEEAPWVDVHSIIAVRGAGDPEKGNDGVVAYESAHLDRAESELVVRSGHSAQGNPNTILEVKRILFEHLAALEAAGEPQAADAP